MQAMDISSTPAFHDRPRTTTGHAHHFLSRLDRIPHTQVQLALSLYNDVPLLKAVLAELRVPEAAAHVAISLDDPREGPFVVVTRDARFVTCLARGMVPCGLHVISRADLDRAANKMQELERRIRHARALTAPGEAWLKVLERVYTAGPALAREEMVTLLGIQPLLHTHFFETMVTLMSRVAESERRLESIARGRSLRRSDRALLRHHWNMHWALTHMLVLTTHRGQRMVDEIPTAAEGLKGLLCTLTMRPATVGGCLRGAWAGASAGRVILPFYKRQWAEAADVTTLIETSTVLAAIGLRNARSRAEVMKALGLGKHAFEAASTLCTPNERARRLLGRCVSVGFDIPTRRPRSRRSVRA